MSNNNSLASVPRIVAQAAAFILLFAVTLSCETEEQTRLSSEKEVISFTIDDVDIFDLEINRHYDLVVSHEFHVSIRARAAYGTDLTAVIPRLEVSPGATLLRMTRPVGVEGTAMTISPEDGTPVDLRDGMGFIITAEDGTTASVCLFIHTMPPQVRTSGDEEPTRINIQINRYPHWAGTTRPTFIRDHDPDFSVHITAVPNPPYRVQNWRINGLICATTGSHTEFGRIVPANTHTIAVHFQEIAERVTVTVQSQNTSMGTVSRVPTNGTVNAGQQVTIRANPTARHEFVGWYRNGVRVAKPWATHSNANFFLTENKTLEARFRLIPTISGPTLICRNGSGTFTIQNLPAGASVTWTHSTNLRHLGGGTFADTGQFSAQTSWVQATVNGFPTRRHELWVGTPFIERIHESNTHTGNIRHYTAELSGGVIQWGLISRFTWDIDAPLGHAGFIGDTHSHEVYVKFYHTGFFTITVRATNACGIGGVQWFHILAFTFSSMRDSTTTYTQSRPISGAFQVLLYEADAREQNKYNVRIYDSLGNRVRQAIAENGSVEFDLSDLPDGTYYLHICNGVDEPVIQPIVVENRNELKV